MGAAQDRPGPLLVTGLPRTGTSWVGKMLELSNAVVYVNEPLNPQHPPGHSPGVLDARVTHRFQYICADNEQDWLPRSGAPRRCDTDCGPSYAPTGPHMTSAGW